MPEDTRQRLIDFFRSVCVQANEAIDAVKNNNFGDAMELLGDCDGDLRQAEEILTEVIDG